MFFFVLFFWKLGQRMTGKRIILSGSIRNISPSATFSVASMASNISCYGKLKKYILLFFFVLFFWKMGQRMTGKRIILSGSIRNFSPSASFSVASMASNLMPLIALLWLACVQLAKALKKVVDTGVPSFFMGQHIWILNNS